MNCQLCNEPARVRYRHSLQGDRIGWLLNQMLAPFISDIVRQRVKHSYPFYSHYDRSLIRNPNQAQQTGGLRKMLSPHTDRLDNEFTLSLQVEHLDFVPRLFFQLSSTMSRQIRSSFTGDVDAWPLWVVTACSFPERAANVKVTKRTRAVACSLNNGDALLFRGRRHIHFRRPMQTGMRLVTCEKVFML